MLFKLGGGEGGGKLNYKCQAPQSFVATLNISLPVLLYNLKKALRVA